MQYKEYSFLSFQVCSLNHESVTIRKVCGEKMMDGKNNINLVTFETEFAPFIHFITPQNESVTLKMPFSPL